MKNIAFIPVVSMFMLSTILNGCNIQAKKQDDSQKGVAEGQGTNADDVSDTVQLSTDTITAFQKFKNQSNEIISDNEKRIADLKIAIRNEKIEAKETYGRDVDGLERNNRELKRRLADYKDDGKSGWRKFKKEFNRDLDTLETDFKDITSGNYK